MQTKFTLTQSALGFYLGIEIVRDRTRHKVYLRQRNFIEKAVEKFSIETDSQYKVTTPMEAGFVDTLDKNSPLLTENFPFREIMGMISFVARFTRPDILVAVNLLCKHYDKHQLKHWKAAKRILRYLHQTKGDWKTLGVKEGYTPLKLEAYSDATYADDVTNSKSRSGGIMLLGGYPVYCYSKLQTTVASSTTQAEYQALYLAAINVVGIRQLLEELGYKQHAATIIWEDNKGAKDLVYTTKHHDRTKHIRVKYHLVRELAARNEIEVKSVGTNDQIADMLTKPLPRLKYEKFKRLMGVQTRGDVIV